MNDNEDEDEGISRGFASPPCFMQDVDPAYLGLAAPAKRSPAMDIVRWRKDTRSRLLADRLSVPAGIRAEQAAQIALRLDQVLGDLSGATVSAYWPFRGEPDLRPWFETVWAQGGHIALPVVTARHSPLVFRLWRKNERLERGIWNILVPADGAPVLPDIVVAPVVGYARTGYRLGYGGGYYDRTLAQLHTHRVVVGVGYKQAELFTIYPQPHDVPMDVIVTEQEIITPAW